MEKQLRSFPIRLVEAGFQEQLARRVLSMCYSAAMLATPVLQSEANLFLRRLVQSDRAGAADVRRVLAAGANLRRS